jgi:hypothetical protein
MQCSAVSEKWTREASSPGLGAGLSVRRGHGTLGSSHAVGVRALCALCGLWECVRCVGRGRTHVAIDARSSSMHAPVNKGVDASVDAGVNTGVNKGVQPRRRAGVNTDVRGSSTHAPCDAFSSSMAASWSACSSSVIARWDAFSSVIVA